MYATMRHRHRDGHSYKLQSRGPSLRDSLRTSLRKFAKSAFQTPFDIRPGHRGLAEQVDSPSTRFHQHNANRRGQAPLGVTAMAGFTDEVDDHPAHGGGISSTPSAVRKQHGRDTRGRAASGSSSASGVGMEDDLEVMVSGALARVH